MIIFHSVMCRGKLLTSRCLAARPSSNNPILSQQFNETQNQAAFAIHSHMQLPNTSLDKEEEEKTQKYH